MTNAPSRTDGVSAESVMLRPVAEMGFFVRSACCGIRRRGRGICRSSDAIGILACPTEFYFVPIGTPCIPAVPTATPANRYSRQPIRPWQCRAKACLCPHRDSSNLLIASGRFHPRVLAGYQTAQYQFQASTFQPLKCSNTTSFYVVTTHKDQMSRVQSVFSASWGLPNTFNCHFGADDHFRCAQHKPSARLQQSPNNPSRLQAAVCKGFGVLYSMSMSMPRSAGPHT
jgi:hypothetical protein|mmetsp:Transcript_82718/g.138292  ORF Transcript_82718/g.138292 Transcript_82718/m.138292 type:complete len:228 (+) Transcript_82718:119-802(+)